ncbi:zf-CCHC domain-containing protein [Tanacetum coccineum]
MSDSEDSTVTYTEISSPYEDLSDIGSPGAEGPIFQDPPSPDYVPGPEEPEQAPPSPIHDEKKSFWKRDEKKGKSDQKCFRCGNPNHLIGECPKPPQNKDQKALVGVSWSDSENVTPPKMCHSGK